MRSKFQTNKRIEESASGLPVEVGFHEAVVKYLWQEERVFHVVDVELAALNSARLLEKEKLGEVVGDGDGVEDRGAGGDGRSDEGKVILGGDHGEEDAGIATGEDEDAEDVHSTAI